MAVCLSEPTLLSSPWLLSASEVVRWCAPQVAAERESPRSSVVRQTSSGFSSALVPQLPSRACLSTSSAWSALASSSAAATAYFLTALAPAAMVQPGSATAPLKQQRGKSTWTGPGRL